ncbi:MAG: hypothetical protein JWR78_52, partial [Mycobacterium sp.]|nr:hypothetical protein [Mycobacterium sp.]
MGRSEATGSVLLPVAGQEVPKPVDRVGE